MNSTAVFFKAKNGDLWDLYGTDGELILDGCNSIEAYNHYDTEGRDEIAYIMYQKDSKHGVLARDGTDIIPLEYAAIERQWINNDDVVFRVTKDGKQGFFRTDGTVIVPVEYDRIGVNNFGNGGYFRVEKNVDDVRLYGMIGLDGAVILPAEYQVLIWWDGSASVPVLARKMASLYGFFRVVGGEAEWVIEPEKGYESANSFSGGLAAVLVDDKWGYINVSGEMVIDPAYVTAGSFSGSLARVGLGDGKYVYGTDENGTELWYWQSYKYGFIDSTGEVVIPIEYDSLSGYFYDNLAFAGKIDDGGKLRYGYINKDGEVVVSPQYEGVTNFSEGLAFYLRGGKWGLLQIVDDGAEAPRFAPQPGSYNNNVSVNFSNWNSSSNIEIRYTINGENPPATTGTVFTGPFSLNTVGEHTIRAVSSNRGTGATSVVSVGTYTITRPNEPQQPAQPTPTPPVEPDPSPPVPANPEPVVIEAEVKTGDDGSVAVTAAVTEDVLADAIAQAVEAAEQGARALITIEAVLPEGINWEDATESNVSIPAELFEQIIDTRVNVAIDAGIGTMTLDGNALNTILDAVSEEGADIVFGVSVVDTETLLDILSPETVAFVADRPVFDFSVSVDGQNIHRLNGRVKVEVPYALAPGENPNAIVVYYLSEDGNLYMKRGSYDSVKGIVSFITDHFSNFMIGYNPVSFTDVPETHEYYDAITFIAAREIALGIGGDLFGPAQSLTRAQLLVMLMKAFGYTAEEAANYDGDNFDDAEGWYAGWLGLAKRDKIAAGIGGNRFGLDTGVTHEQMVLLLY
ncbi:MAG: WG repeat-containing protein, partial [Oscillospiraceae bacterium]|nr:WG repeat-containing protein [Oscillospiraceae bacterium]